jgi:hypothetical protein
VGCWCFPEMCIDFLYQNRFGLRQTRRQRSYVHVDKDGPALLTCTLLRHSVVIAVIREPDTPGGFILNMP